MLEISSCSHSIALIFFVERVPIENVLFPGITILQFSQYKLSYIILLIFLKISSYRAKKSLPRNTYDMTGFYMASEGMLGEG